MSRSSHLIFGLLILISCKSKSDAADYLARAPARSSADAKGGTTEPEIINPAPSEGEKPQGENPSRPEIPTP